MSQLLDSLRRVAASSAAPAAQPYKPAPDVILARMGYARKPSGSSRLLLLVVLALSALALIWAGLAASRRPTVESTRSPVPRAGTTGQPAHPAPGASIRGSRTLIGGCGNPGRSRVRPRA